MHLDKKIGSIEVGKLADILVVDGDPVKNISILLQEKCISRVYKDGILVIAR